MIDITEARSYVLARCPAAVPVGAGRAVAAVVGGVDALVGAPLMVVFLRVVGGELIA